eukprot:TRINITY_DN19102_c0_g1_i3.p1 TRINITY_DN19102_c0_g1~~TRINITY_DN19102_c0_g1_i3.p1  ORF type:complete len:416 (+),score=27.83 TRINITY_DN19102_c0_g1_i3:26-1249(+)
MRTWSLDLDLQTQELRTFLGNLSTKGISCMRNFKLQFKNVKNEASVALLREWQHHIYHLEISPLASYQFHAKNLESLVIINAGAENISGNGVVMNELVNAHSASLRKLTVFPTDCMNGDAQVYRELPLMKSMLINGNASKDILRSLFSNPSKHITVLSLSQHVNVRGINSSHLKLPQLKQLKVEGPDNLPLLCANAEQIEILTVQTKKHRPWFAFGEALFNVDIDLPESLPKLKMLSFEYYCPENMAILSKLLIASSETVKYLLLHCPVDVIGPLNYTLETFAMKNLTSFVFNHFPEFIYRIVEENSSNLEAIIIGMGYYTFNKTESIGTLSLHPDLPRLQGIIMTDDYIYQQNSRAEPQCKLSEQCNQFRQTYPNAKIITKPHVWYSDYVNHIMRLYKADKLLNFV